MFVFGTQYLRGETPSRNDWEKDFHEMKKCGFNTVRAWLVWNSVEKSEGNIDHAYLNTFLDLAGKYGIRVGLLLHLHGAPEWLIRKYPQYYYVNAEGLPFEPSQRGNTPSGGWPGLCYDFEEVRGLEEKFISEVVGCLAEREEIAFWEPMNEPHQWVDLAKHPAGVFCYCSASRRKFRKWLKSKYGDLKKLNAAWGMNHSSWDEVRPPTWKFGYTNYIDFRLFTMDNVREEINWRSGLIRKHDKRRPVIAHAWGGGSITCPDLGAMAFDDWKNSTVFDIWGYSAFPDSYRQNVMIGLGTDATRSAGHGKTIWQAELGAGDIGSGLRRRGRVKPEVLAGWSWESIRHGSKGLLYWQYRKEAHGSEFGSPALTDYEGGATENLEMASHIGSILQNNEKLFTDSKVEEAEAAIIFSMQSYLTDWCDYRNNHLSIDCISGYYRMFWEENIPVDILHEDFTGAEGLRKYKLVILPQPSALSANIKKALAEYTENGGAVLSDPYLCAFDQEFHLSRKIPGENFHVIFGCEEKDIYSAEGKEIAVKYGESDYLIGNSHFKEVFKNVTAEALATYTDGSPCILLNSYGRGKAMMAGLNLGLSYSPRQGVGDDFIRNECREVLPGAKEIVMDMVRGLGIKSSFTVDNSNIQGGFLLNDAAEDILILMNNSEAGQTSGINTGSLRYICYTNMVDGSAGSLENGLMRLQFKPLETMVLKMTKLDGRGV